MKLIAEHSEYTWSGAHPPLVSNPVFFLSICIILQDAVTWEEGRTKQKWTVQEQIRATRAEAADVTVVFCK